MTTPNPHSHPESSSERFSADVWAETLVNDSLTCIEYHLIPANPDALQDAAFELDLTVYILLENCYYGFAWELTDRANKLIARFFDGDLESDL